MSDAYGGLRQRTSKIVRLGKRLMQQLESKFAMATIEPNSNN
ncbi:MAG: hypothetical protein V7L21_08425 [Nostoc sp.]|nr:hypothetical protein [Nostoc sp. NMS9]